MAKKSKKKMPVIMSDANQHNRERALRIEKRRAYVTAKLAELRARQMAEYETNINSRGGTVDGLQKEE